MFRYRLHLEDGSDAGEATYAQMIKPNKENLRRPGLTKRRRPRRATCIDP